jgi:HSP20 family protein
MAKAPKRHGFPLGFGLWDDDFESVFDRMREEMGEMMKGFGSIDEEDLEKSGGKSYVRGYSITMGPEGKPTIREFGNKPKVMKQGKIKGISEEREPLIDIIEDKQKITIIAEVPGVAKDNIHLKTSDNSLEIKVDTPNRKYHKVVALPCAVKPMSAKANYKNGVLEVIFERAEPKNEKGEGHRIKVE